MNATPLHIGIVACSAEGAALCYRILCAQGAPRWTVRWAAGPPDGGQI